MTSAVAQQTAEGLVERLLAGERPALSRLISWAENGDARFPAALAKLFPRTGAAWRIGVTGPPGAGKSTLVNELVRGLRARGGTVGVLAVDPTSPFSGGALLGDRIRMEERTLDPGVFIRSMASRDGHGGLARAAVDALDVMDAFGFASLVVETVGVGQAEYDVVAAADVVLVVLCPGAGDGIQAMKSGLLEVADVLVVNKADQPGADRLVVDLEEAVHVRQAGRTAWQTPVVACSAGTGRDVDSVLEAIESRRAFLEERDEVASRRRRHRVEQARKALVERLADRVWSAPATRARVESLIASGRAPYDVANELYQELARAMPTEGADA